MSTRLIQLENTSRRRVALVEEPHLRLLDTDSIYSLAESAIRSGIKLSEAAKRSATADTLDYGPIYNGNSEWKILSPIDHFFHQLVQFMQTVSCRTVFCFIVFEWL